MKDAIIPTTIVSMAPNGTNHI